MKRLLSIVAIITVFLTAASFNQKGSGAFFFISPIPNATCEYITEGCVYIGSPTPTHYILETYNYPISGPGWQAFSFTEGQFSSLWEATIFLQTRHIQYRCASTFEFDTSCF